jgi:hypothetical protein
MKIRTSLLLVVFVFVGCGKEDASKKGAGSETPAPVVAVDAGKVAVVVDAAAAAAPTVVVDAAKAAPAPEVAVPPELAKLEEMITPILAMTDEDARIKAACKELDAITKQMWTVARNPPEGVDKAAWTEVGERMASPLNDFAIECAEGEYYNTKALAESAETAKEFLPLLARKPN